MDWSCTVQYACSVPKGSALTHSRTAFIQNDKRLLSSNSQRFFALLCIKSIAMRVKIITKSIEGFGWCSISLSLDLVAFLKSLNIYTFMPLKKENKKNRHRMRSRALTVYCLPFFPSNLFVSASIRSVLFRLFLFLLLLTHTRQVDNDSDKTGCDDHGISRVSLTRLFYSPRLPFAATTITTATTTTFCVTCIGLIIIELCFGLAPSGFPLARRIGHPYQQRTPPKRKKPRTSFTRLQVNYN